VHAAPISDDELAALALAADPDAVVADDAVPFRADSPRRDEVTTLLPAWYMPRPAASGGGRLRRLVIAGVVGALLVVSGAGLCVTYGIAQIAW
jgi:hypothetical protein